MEFSELKEQVYKAPLSQRKDLEFLFLATTAGPNVKPQFADYLQQSSSYIEFFDAIYECDEYRFTPIWAKWARLRGKTWLKRFEPDLFLENLKLKAAGLPIAFEGGVVLAPAANYDNIVNFFVFKQGAFNTNAANFITSVGGQFNCADYEFKGIYGIYSYQDNVILEEWQSEAQPFYKPLPE